MVSIAWHVSADRDFPNTEVPTSLFQQLIPRDEFYTVVAESDGPSSAATCSGRTARSPASVRSRSSEPPTPGLQRRALLPDRPRTAQRLDALCRHCAVSSSRARRP